jgi:anti-sigma-K factor RskA
MPDLTDENEIDDNEGDDDLEQLRALAGRVGGEPVPWEAPPEHLWQRIAVEAGVRYDDEADDGDPGAAGAGAGATVHRFERSRSWFTRPLTLVAAAAAVVVAVGIVGSLAIDRERDNSTILASAGLELLGDRDRGEGEAELVDDGGQMRLRVETAEVDAGDDNFLEVWVIDPDVTRLVSLGPLRSDGLYDLPAGLDPEQYPIVDVSVEPIDGDPTHSGDSVLRGQLEF